MKAVIDTNADIVTPIALNRQVCSDKDDDEFLAVALAGGAKVIVSGDKALPRTDGYEGIRIVTPATLE
jgi:predicted nucleic acid-binding protein